MSKDDQSTLVHWDPLSKWAQIPNKFKRASIKQKLDIVFEDSSENKSDFIDNDDSKSEPSPDYSNDTLEDDDTPEDHLEPTTTDYEVQLDEPDHIESNIQRRRPNSALADINKISSGQLTPQKLDKENALVHSPDLNHQSDSFPDIKYKRDKRNKSLSLNNSATNLRTPYDWQYLVSTWEDKVKAQSPGRPSKRSGSPQTQVFNYSLELKAHGESSGQK